LFATTGPHGPDHSSASGLCLASVLLALLAAALMLGAGQRITPAVPLAACGLALLLLLGSRLGARASGLQLPAHLPVPAYRVSPRARPAPDRSAPDRSALGPSLGTPAATAPAACGARAPLQGLAQAQGDHRFLLECRRNLAGRWLVLVAEMEAAWACRDLGELRWSLYQIRRQSALWGMSALCSQAQRLEELLEHAGTVGFDTRCDRALERLRASVEGPVEA